MNEIYESDFNKLSIKAHQFLADVPIHSLDFIELKGGRKGMLMDEIYRIIGLNQAEEYKFGFITDFLFWLRGQIGKILKWDNVPELVNANSWIKKLTQEEREKSLIPTGKVESINTILYCYEKEIMFEIVNRTVHCFWVLAAVEKAGGYDLYVAIYVKKLNWRTPIYMTLVSPILKWVIYPAVKKNIKRNWEARFSSSRISPTKELKV